MRIAATFGVLSLGAVVIVLVSSNLGGEVAIDAGDSGAQASMEAVSAKTPSVRNIEPTLSAFKSEAAASDVGGYATEYDDLSATDEPVSNDPQVTQTAHEIRQDKVNAVSIAMDIWMSSLDDKRHTELEAFVEKIRSSPENEVWRGNVEAVVGPALASIRETADDSDRIVLECGLHSCVLTGFSREEDGEKIMYALAAKHEQSEIASAVGLPSEKYTYTIFIVSLDFRM